MTGIQLRRHPGPDAQLLGPRARQPRVRAQREPGRQSARGRAAGPRQDARARGARLPAGRAAAARAARRAARCARSGFAGSDADVLARAARDAPRLLAACSSAAAMWVANAATVSPSADTADGRVHFTPANLAVALPPRARGADDDARCCARSSPTRARFVVHDPLPAAPQTGDEGAANHTRLVARDGAGVEFFVYGRRGVRRRAPLPARFPARQTREASRGDRAPPRPRRRRAPCSRSRIPRRSTPACSTTT